MKHDLVGYPILNDQVYNGTVNMLNTSSTALSNSSATAAMRQRKCKNAVQLRRFDLTPETSLKEHNNLPPNGHLCEVALEWRNLGWTHIRFCTPANGARVRGSLLSTNRIDDRNDLCIAMYSEAVA
jgi:hypothetical protein